MILQIIMQAVKSFGKRLSESTRDNSIVTLILEQKHTTETVFINYSWVAMLSSIIQHFPFLENKEIAASANNPFYCIH